jgi:uracil-DNA glycosylase
MRRYSMAPQQIEFIGGAAVNADPDRPESDGEARSWRDVLAEEKAKPYFKEALAFVERERRAGKTIYPPNADVFNAFQFTPFDRVKVVILGQDPYHGPGQAHGLCFSVRPGIPFPPSLHNIFKEISADLKTPPPKDGCLERWAHQGVLLLNAVLTVEGGKPQSHAGIGWEQFTDQVVRVLNEERRGLVFLLWGSPAQKKGAIIDPSRHHVLKCPHPSPLSASRGFFGCRHFSKANELLSAQGLEPIVW